MDARRFDPAALQKLRRERSVDERTQSNNGVSTPNADRLREAVREANDPKRLISDPQNSDGFPVRR